MHSWITKALYGLLIKPTVEQCAALQKAREAMGDTRAAQQQAMPRSVSYRSAQRRYMRFQIGHTP